MADTPVSPLRRSPLFWALVLLLLALVGCIGWLSYSLFTMKLTHTKAALDNGQLVRIDVQSGEVDGNIDMSGKTVTSTEAYKRRRVRELTGRALEDIAPPKETSGPAKAAQGKADTTTAEKDGNATPPPAEDSSLRPFKSEGRTPLKAAPLPGLVETLPSGVTLPTRNDKKGMVPWQYYSKPAQVPDGHRMLSLVITDVGLSLPDTRRLLRLDEHLTLAFSPYTTDVNQRVTAARASGFETWLVLPLQHEDYPVHDYGPLTLLTDDTVEGNKNKLLELLSLADGITGVISTPEERFSKSDQMRSVFNQLAERGVLLGLYNKLFSPPAYPHMVIRPRKPHWGSMNTPAEAEALFQQIETAVAAQGDAVITIDAMPGIVSQLPQWIASLPEKRISLVPLSAHARKAQEQNQ